jgi:quinol monooxygenase YgiN
MILVTGSILAREEAFDDVLRACLDHVERSRKEPGCISHHVHVAVEGSKAFVKSLKGRIVETSGTRIYRAESIPR